MTRKRATESLIHILKIISLVVAPIGTAGAIVEWLFDDRYYTVVAVIFAAILIYLVWLDLRIRTLEEKK